MEDTEKQRNDWSPDAVPVFSVWVIIGFFTETMLLINIILANTLFIVSLVFVSGTISFLGAKALFFQLKKKIPKTNGILFLMSTLGFCAGVSLAQFLNTMGYSPNIH